MDYNKSYNPENRRDNCGFCSLSVALDVQGRGFRDAERLYLDTITDLGLKINDGRDPVSRKLIFPQHGLGTMNIPENYENLTGIIGLDDYKITSVADRLHLKFEYQTKKETELATALTAAHFLAFYAAQPGMVNINQFIELKRQQQFERLQQAEKGGPSVRSVQAMRDDLTRMLVGHSIVGSTRAEHYMTMHVTPNFEVRAFDPQDRKQYDAKGLMLRMKQDVNLVMHLKP